MEGSGEGYWLGHRERLRLRLTVTGSPANRYSSVHIPYGLTGVSGSSPR